MVYKYKSRKNKRRLNFRRQSRRAMRGGAESLEEGKTPVEIKPSVDVEPPSTLTNLEKGAEIGAQVVDNLVANGLEYAEDGVKTAMESAGLDPNLTVEDQIKKIGETTTKLKDVISSPEGQKALSNLGNIASEVADKVIAPSIEKTSDAIVEHSGPILNKATNAAMDAFSATPAGFLLDVPKFFNDVAGIVEDSTAMVADVLDITKDTVEKTQETKKEMDSAWSQVTGLLDNVNKTISSSLDKIEDKVDDYGKKIVEEGKSEVSNKIPESAQVAGNMLKAYKNESKMVGGRVKDSFSNFTKVYVTGPQIIKQYGGTRKRRIIKRNRLYSRRHK